MTTSTAPPGRRHAAFPNECRRSREGGTLPAMDDVTLTREELYDLVWSTPIRTLAGRFGISDVALSKKCAKHDIPTPGLGYWAKVAAGQKLKKERLPKASPGTPQQVVFTNRFLPPSTDDTGATAPVAPPLVNVAERLTDPHEVVAWLKDSLQQATPDHHDRLVVGTSWCQKVTLRPSCVPRALLLLDALFKALESRGHRVVAGNRFEGEPEKQILVHSSDEEFGIELEERLSRKPHVLTREERDHESRWGRSNAPKYDYFANGHLRIRLTLTHYKYRGRSSWSDTKTKQVDGLLGHAVLAVENAVAVSVQEKRDEARRAAEELAEKRKRLRGQRLKWYGKWLAKDLERMVEDWERARRVREFLAEYDQHVPSDGMSEVAARWRNATGQFAENLDPMNHVAELAKELEPSDEVLEALMPRSMEEEE